MAGSENMRIGIICRKDGNKYRIDYMINSYYLAIREKGKTTYHKLSDEFIAAKDFERGPELARYIANKFGIIDLIVTPKELQVTEKKAGMKIPWKANLKYNIRGDRGDTTETVISNVERFLREEEEKIKELYRDDLTRQATA